MAQTPAKSQQTGHNPAPVAAPLETLFSGFAKARINWCSWKSNQHLDAALKGQTDIDLLFEPGSEDEVETVFRKEGFKILRTAWFRTFPGMMDAFALDPETGNLIHAHCHFQLILGEKYLKSYIVPWADEMLSRRMSFRDAPAAITADPADEMLLLIVRAALKLRWFDDPATKKIDKSEFYWLKNRVSQSQLRENAARLISPECAAIIDEVYESDMKGEKLDELQKRLRETFTGNGWRRMGQAQALLEQNTRQFLSLAASAQSRFNILWPYFRRRRALNGNGLLIAIMGSDGSGKSSVVSGLSNAWRRKIDVPRIYFGRAKLPGILKKKSGETKTHAEISKSESWPFIARAAFDAARKRFLMRCAVQMRRAGAIVICDRFPQNQFEGFNDGPLLSHLKDSEHKIRRAFARWEEKQFAKLGATAPDIVIRLTPSLENALARKPGENAPAYLQMKMDALKNLRFPATTKIHTIDADKDLAAVIRAARVIIWDAILAGGAQHTLCECFGLPGSGKTTISNKANETLHMQTVDGLSLYWKQTPFTGKLRLFLQSFAEEPSLWLQCLLFALRNNLWRDQDSFARCLEIPVRKTIAREILKNRSLLLDQWMLQSLWSALLNVKLENPHGLKKLCKKLYANLPAKIFYFPLDAAAATDRIMSRATSGSRFDKLPHEQIRPELQNAATITQNLITAARKAGVPVTEINSSQSADAAAEDICRACRD